MSKRRRCPGGGSKDLLKLYSVMYPFTSFASTPRVDYAQAAVGQIACMTGRRFAPKRL